MSQLSKHQRETLLAALPKLRRFCLSMTGSAADADDLLQTTVERLLARGIGADVDPIRWAYRVCKNIWIDELRSKEVRTRMSWKVGDDTDTAHNADDVLDATQRAERLQKAMAELPDEQRMVLALVAIEGRSYAETAEILDIPAGTVMSRLARARAALAARMHSEESDGHD
ncbi:MAG: sigma-70 family RNA polymerase sigma factor [Pseudomonadota bacterium]